MKQTISVLVFHVRNSRRQNFGRNVGKDSVYNWHGIV